ncbi:hypothetical protein [Maricaulis sp.]|uniref:hypothetical protein n=1 Tax=Maricaulis sp. TaxID=1486257 RepID=UPI002626384C|nr:hypothetical protein [Maricaulis sp.]
MTATTALPAGEIRKLTTRRTRVQDDVIADYLGLVVRPGDRTLQIGASDLGAVCLQRGARHEIVAPVSAIEALQAVCDRRAIPADALRGGLAARTDGHERPIDVAIFGPETGFPAMAANWRHVSSSMREGGILVLLGADHGAAARLADALIMDEAWVLQERMCGDAAVFRKASDADNVRTLQTLSAAGRPGRRPRGVRRGPIAAIVRRLFPRRPRNKARATG